MMRVIDSIAGKYPTEAMASNEKPAAAAAQESQPLKADADVPAQASVPQELTKSQLETLC